MAIAATRDRESAPFFDATADGRLLLMQCTSCGATVAPYCFPLVSNPRVCPQCSGDAWAWTASSGSGTIVSWTAVHGRPDPQGRIEHVVVVLVELAEGPWVTGRFRGDEPALRVGAPVTAMFDATGDGEPVPVFGSCARSSTNATDGAGV